MCAPIAPDGKDVEAAHAHLGAEAKRLMRARLIDQRAQRSQLLRRLESPARRDQPAGKAVPPAAVPQGGHVPSRGTVARLPRSGTNRIGLTRTRAEASQSRAMARVDPAVPLPAENSFCPPADLAALTFETTRELAPELVDQPRAHEALRFGTRDGRARLQHLCHGAIGAHIQGSVRAGNTPRASAPTIRLGLCQQFHNPASPRGRSRCPPAGRRRWTRRWTT